METVLLVGNDACGRRQLDHLHLWKTLNSTNHSKAQNLFWDITFFFLTITILSAHPTQTLRSVDCGLVSLRCTLLKLQQDLGVKGPTLFKTLPTLQL